MTIIKGKGFVLRPIRMSDAKGILECYRDEKTIKCYRISLSNIQAAKKYCEKSMVEFKKKNHEREKWAIEVDKEFAGWVVLIDLHRKFSEHAASIGYCVHPKFRGRGLATSATKLLSNYAFEKYNLKRISAICRTFNKESARVLEKSGFKLEGVLRKNTFKDGRYMDDMLWAKVK